MIYSRGRPLPHVEAWERRYDPCCWFAVEATHLEVVPVNRDPSNLDQWVRLSFWAPGVRYATQQELT
ncbi:MAG: hypothetical protein AAGI88_14165 [Pseudomonadota bacterium]